MAENKIRVAEVKFAIKACAKHRDLERQAEGAKEIKSAAMIGVLERLLGVKSWEDVAVMGPDEIGKIARRRVKKGEVELEGFSLEELLMVIQKTQARRNVSWKDAFVAELGEAAADKVIADTQETFSYRFGEGQLGVEVPA